MKYPTHMPIYILTAFPIPLLKIVQYARVFNVLQGSGVLN